MKKWIKSYWDRCLSIVAIICSIVAISFALPSTKPVDIDYIGVLVGILSLLVTILIGWQIWSIIAIDKKINEKVDIASKKINIKVDTANDSLKKEIDTARDNLAISGVRATTAMFYKAESTNLNIYLFAGKGNYRMAINTLKIMLGYATALKEDETLRDIARLIVETHKAMNKTGIIDQDQQVIRSSFQELSRNVLNLLPASDAHVPALLGLLRG